MTRGKKLESLAKLFPEIAKEWDYEENDGTPEDYPANSSTIVQWICPKGHKYKTRISLRTLRGDGCSICSGNQIIVGVNDLGSVKPELMVEWDFDKNHFIYPTEVTVMANRKVWWKCSVCGHSWEALISNRTRGSGCPKCRYKKIVAKRRSKAIRYTGTSFGETFPELLKEWDYEKNKDIADPMKVTRGSAKKVWWKCSKCGHSWQATVNNRSRGSGCKPCSFKSEKHPHRKNKEAA